MTAYWQRIEDWITSNHPAVLATLNAPASVVELDKVESVLNAKLPEDFKLFLSVHNGQAQTHLSLFDGDSLLSTEDIITEWESWNSILPSINEETIKLSGEPITSEPDSGVRNDWWHTGWIPFTNDGCGNSYCIDVAPTSEGKSGQIIRMWHDDASRPIVAASFSEWIDAYVLDLEKGAYAPSNNLGWGGIIKK